MLPDEQEKTLIYQNIIDLLKKFNLNRYLTTTKDKNHFKRRIIIFY